MRWWMGLGLGLALAGCDDGDAADADTGGADVADVTGAPEDTVEPPTDTIVVTTADTTTAPSDTTATTATDTSATTVTDTAVAPDVVTCDAPLLECSSGCVATSETLVANDVATTNTVSATSSVRQGVKDTPVGPWRIASISIWLDAGVGPTHVELPIPTGQASSTIIDVTTTGWQQFVFDPPVRPAGNVQFPSSPATSFTLRFAGARTLPTNLNVYTNALTFLDLEQPNGSFIGDSSNDLRFIIDFERCPSP